MKGTFELIASLEKYNIPLLIPHPLFPVQVRDEYRQDYDPARGGYGKLAQQHRPAEVQNTF